MIIRTNLDNTNKTSFSGIFSEFNKRWKGKNIFVTPAFVKDFSSVDENFALNGCRDACLDRKQKLDFFEDLYKKHNIDVDFATEHCIGGCGATVTNYYVIGPEGELYKCWNDIGTKNRVVGYVNCNDITNYELTTRYLSGPSMLDDEECVNCKLFPICDGGCPWARHKNIYEGGELELCSSRKDNMDQAFEIYYEQLLSK